MGITYEELAAAVAKAGSQVRSFKSEHEQAIAAQAIQFKATTAFSPSAKGDVAAEQRLNAELARGTEETKARALAEGDRRLAIHQVTVAMQEQARERLLTATQAAATARLEVSLIGKSIEDRARETANLQAQQQIYSEAARARTLVNGQLSGQDQKRLEQIKEQNAELARQKQLEALKTLTGRVEFDRATMFFSPNELKIAQEMERIYGDGWPAAMKSAEAGMLRMQMQQVDMWNAAKSGVEQFTSSLVNGLMSGTSMMDSLHNSLESLSKSMANNAIKDLFSGNFEKAGIEAVIAIGSKLLSGSFDDSQEKELKKAKQAWACMVGPMVEFVVAAAEAMKEDGLRSAIAQPRIVASSTTKTGKARVYDFDQYHRAA